MQQHSNVSRLQCAESYCQMGCGVLKVIFTTNNICWSSTTWKLAKTESWMFLEECENLLHKKANPCMKSQLQFQIPSLCGISWFLLNLFFSLDQPKKTKEKIIDTKVFVVVAFRKKKMPGCIFSFQIVMMTTFLTDNGCLTFGF